MYICAPDINENEAAFSYRFCADNTTPRYVLGINPHSESIARHIDIDGFIDDFTPLKSHMGKPIISSDQLLPDARVIVCSMLRPITAAKRLSEKNISYIHYFAFRKYVDIDLYPVCFWNEFHDDFAHNRKKYETIYSLLADETSKKTFEDIINFRLTGDVSHMSPYTYRIDDQYFESFLALQSKGESFVDVGGYRGETSLEFIKYSPEFDHIYLFEPDPVNFEAAQKALSPYPNATLFNSGLSDKKDILFFDAGLGSSSKVCTTGEMSIAVDAMDDLISNPVTFIKMDIEGGESNAIEGAKHLIRKNHPKLAICVYHKYNDFWAIPEQIMAIESRYKLYMRHYTEGIDETIMFFIPVKS